MGAVYDRIQRLKAAWQDLTTAERQEYRASIVAVVQRGRPDLDNAEAWQFFLDAPVRQQRKAIQRAQADLQAEAIRAAIEPLVPYQRTIGAYTYRITQFSVRQREDLVIRMRVTLEKGGEDITPPEIAAPEYVQIINPPVFIVDDAGEIEETITDVNGDTFTQRKTENPLRALRVMVEDTLRGLIRKNNL